MEFKMRNYRGMTKEGEWKVGACEEYTVRIEQFKLTGELFLQVRLACEMVRRAIRAHP